VYTEYLRAFLYSSDDRVARGVDDVVDVAVLVVCRFRNFDDLVKRPCHVECNGECAFLCQFSKARCAACCSDDFVSARQGFEGNMFSETARGGSDEPYWGLGVHCEG
jgi:hypothetical protein